MNKASETRETSKIACKIVVYTGELGYPVRKNIIEVDREFEECEWLIVEHKPKKGTARLLKNQLNNFRKNGWRWIPYQLSDVFTRIVGARQDSSVFSGSPGYTYSTDFLESLPNVTIISTSNINGEHACQHIRKFEPDLGLSLAAPILKSDVFSIPRLGTINLHKGKVPDYRGMPPAFWELWQGETEIGCTVHQVESGLDTGDIICEKSIPVSQYSTMKGLQLTLDEVGIGLMKEAIIGLLNGAVQSRSQPPGGRTFTKPTLSQISKLNSRMPSPVSGSRARAVLKNLWASINWHIYSLVTWRIITPRINVLLYHRVTDDVRDNLSTGIEQFDTHMALLRKNCNVLGISQILDMKKIPRSRKPLVAITFDDGYLDNYVHAAAILERHGLDAAFYVSTGIIGTTDGTFPHDDSRRNPYIPVMQWDQVRDMLERGFSIGSHTVNHIDCAAESESLVRDELSESMTKLRLELGCEDLVLAYPYGGKNHMTPSRLELVKKAGYIGCLSAYGGSNLKHVDRFNIFRRGIHWEFSKSALLYECIRK